jgi:hypothetical protein
MESYWISGFKYDSFEEHLNQPSVPSSPQTFCTGGSSDDELDSILDELGIALDDDLALDEDCTLEELDCSPEELDISLDEAFSLDEIDFPLLDVALEDISAESLDELSVVSLDELTLLDSDGSNADDVSSQAKKNTQAIASAVFNKNFIRPPFPFLLYTHFPL